jgi:TRAP-type mannitol/chloroaromatic compound transport system substrate-binding protein
MAATAWRCTMSWARSSTCAFIAGQTGAQGGGWFRNPITSAGDLQGLKFRMPGLGGEALTKVGVSVQVLPGGEIYQALSTGSLDGTEWIGPWSDERLGLQEVCNYYYPAGFHEPGAALSVGTNLERFNALARAPEGNRAGLRRRAPAQLRAVHRQQRPGAAAPDLGRASANQFPDDVWDAFATAREVLGGYRGDPLYDTGLDSAMASMRATSGWLSVADTPYVEQRTRVLQDM